MLRAQPIAVKHSLGWSNIFPHRVCVLLGLPHLGGGCIVSLDVFTGGALDADQKSIAIAVTLQPTEATLTDAEIEAASDKIIANVAKQTGGVLRG